MKPAVREFSKDAPCSKLDIYNCFRGPNGYQRVQVDVAYSVIGKSVPRVLERDGKAVRLHTKENVEYFALTQFGEEWLDKGIRSYIKNHPYREEELIYPLSGGPPGGRVRRRRA